MSRHSVVTAVVLFALSVVTALPSTAAPIFVVNSTADVVAAPPLDSGPCETVPGNNVCTLRAAIMKANHTPGGGATIRFGLPGVVTHVLSIPRTTSGDLDEASGDLNIKANLTIEGNGPGNTIIDGNGSVTTSRIFQANQGTTLTVKIAGVTLQNGLADFGGGAIYNAGVLTIENSVIRNNKVQSSGFQGEGGAIASTGSLVLKSVTIASNSVSGSGSAVAHGGGIRVQGSLQIIDSTISGNFAQTVGGGISIGGAQASILRSTISGNQSRSDGGGVMVDSTGTLDITDTTISGNVSNMNGGGLAVMAPGSVRLYNTTVAVNAANIEGTGAGRGGGISAESNSTVTLANSVVANNVYATRVGPAMTLVTLSSDCKGTVSTAGPSLFLFNDTANCTINGTPIFGEPKLGSLAANGGRTATHALGAGSPAIDAGSASGCTGPLGNLLVADQRGAPRVPAPGGRCDLGAFEVGPLFTLDVDASNAATRYDALTDGLLAVRHMFGISGASLTARAIGATATRTNPAVITGLLDANRTALDIDGNGVADAATDGLLILRHLFGMTGDALVRSAVGSGATRNTAPLVEAYLQTLKP